MLKVGVYWSEATDAYKAGKESAEKALAKLGGKADFAMAFCTVPYNEVKFVQGIRDVVGEDVPFIGGTSHAGILTPGGYLHKESGAGGVILLASPEIGFGVGIAETGDDPRATGRKAVKAAIAQAGKSESDPVSAYFLIASPGAEERIIKGIQDVIGRVPMVGGSAGNNGGEDPIKEFGNSDIVLNGAAVAVIYSDLPLGVAFTGYYKPTDNHGVITKVRDLRTLVEIDGRKALDVYAEWRGVKVEDVAGGTLLLDSIPFPLGRVDVGGDHWWIMHPINGNEDGSIATGSDMAVGTGVTLMEATMEEVAQGAVAVVKMALEDLGGEANAVIVGHCGGRAMGLGADNMKKINANIKHALGDIPFIGYLTFGEQGFAKWSSSGSGGLMLMALAFGAGTK